MRRASPSATRSRGRSSLSANGVRIVGGIGHQSGGVQRGARRHQEFGHGRVQDGTTDLAGDNLRDERDANRPPNEEHTVQVGWCQVVGLETAHQRRRRICHLDADHLFEFDPRETDAALRLVMEPDSNLGVRVGREDDLGSSALERAAHGAS